MKRQCAELFAVICHLSHHNAANAICIEELRDCLIPLANVNHPFFLAGDFNVPHIDWKEGLLVPGSTAATLSFYECILELGLVQFVMEPTYQTI